MIHFLKKPINILLLAVILDSAFIGYTYFRPEEKSAFDVAVAKRGDLVQEISVTGRVAPVKSVALAFEKGGKISRVWADVGTEVRSGEVLVTLESGELSAQLSQAQAGVESAKAGREQYQAALEIQKAKLAELARGTRIEEIQVQEIKAANAAAARLDAQKNLVDALADAYTKSDDAVRAKTNQLFDNPQTQNPQLKFGAFDPNTGNDLELRRVSLEYDVFPEWQSSLGLLSPQSDWGAYVIEGKKHLGTIKTFLDQLALVINNPNISYIENGTSQELPDAWKTDTATARTTINAAIGGLTAAEEKLSATESSLALAEQELTLKKAGTTEEQIMAQEAQIKQAESNIASQEAQIKQAEANVQNYRAQIAKAVIRAPLSGIITKQDAKVGEIVSANAPLVFLMSVSLFEVRANVPEADIAKLSVGDAATIGLDAYGSDAAFGATVVSIDPAETVVDGVATYTAAFQFTERDERIKSGMTANIDIVTDKREGVIVIPQRAIISKNGTKFVQILAKEIPQEVNVTTGLRGSDGNIEITEGVQEGDAVVTFFD